MEMRSHLSRARGLGSNNEGAHHWRWQRITGIALVPLCITDSNLCMIFCVLTLSQPAP